MKQLLTKVEDIRALIAVENQHFHHAATQQKKISDLEEIYTRVAQLQSELHHVYTLIDYSMLRMVGKNPVQH